MINLKFGLFWCGSKLSYLRYLTFKSLRHFHPDAVIELYESDAYASGNVQWKDEAQDFQSDDQDQDQDYRDNLSELNIDRYKINMFSKYAPNYQSDFFRWWWLNNNSGFYMDTDQIVLRNFSTLPLDNNFIYSEYKAQSCGIYSPVGVLGADSSEIVQWTNTIINQFHRNDDYNSMGPWAMRTMLRMRPWKDKMFNAPSNYFYPVPESYMVNSIYNGKFYPDKESYCLHWFGGHKLSQSFNRQYSVEKAQFSLDSISSILRIKRII